MNVVLRTLAGLLALWLAGCATQPMSAMAATTFVVVRHAEKASDDPRDPTLTDAGRARAEALAASLAEAPLAAVYATAYRRTQLTAAPSATAHGLAVVTYDAAQPAADFAARLKRAHPHGTVLVVGHSNTAPEIAAALCACAVAPIGEAEFDRRMTVRVDAEGGATLMVSRD